MEEKEFDYINVIPLVDIMLVLLTVVLTTSTFIASGVIPVELPKTTKSHEGTLESIVIIIDAKGGLYLNSAPLSEASLPQALAPLSRSTPVLIRADRSIALQIFVDVMDKVKSAGFHRINLQTEVGGG